LDVEELSAVAIDCGLQVHRDLGPGMLESAYEAVLAHLLVRRGLAVERQKIIPLHYEGLIIDQGFRADLVVEDRLLIELKAVERLSSVHGRQVLTYLKFMNLPMGLLMNFATDLFRDGLKRVVNKHVDTANSRLNINQQPSRTFASSRPSREIDN
jgi:GxxExxY protein